jgi:hypothetical protein
MYIEIKTGPWLMVLAWSILTLAAVSVAYGFARTAEHSLAHLGEERATIGEYWGWSDVWFGIVMAAIMVFVAMFPAEAAVCWLHKALGQ